jgi:hypothetical protein
MIASKAGAYLSEASFRRSTLGRLLTVPTNMRLEWQGLPGKNTLACYKHPKITDVKSFITFVPGVMVIKHFFFAIGATVE